MCQIVIKIPEAVLYDTHMSSDDAAAFARRTVAMVLYAEQCVDWLLCGDCGHDRRKFYQISETESD